MLKFEFLLLGCYLCSVFLSVNAAVISASVGQDLVYPVPQPQPLQDLGTLGRTDWRVWNYATSIVTPSAEKKDASNISDLSLSGGSTMSDDSWPNFTWLSADEQSGLSPSTDITKGIKSHGSTQTFSLNISSLGLSGNVRVYAGAWACIGTLTATIGSDSTQASFENSNGYGWFDINYSEVVDSEAILNISYTTDGTDMKFWGVAFDNSTVPEPDTVAMLIAGVSIALLFRYRKSRGQ